ncbi:DUF805 domain-containing protein [Propionibacterium freudenreichii]|uniref:DUF805 domain-containing protein n=7 Tax=Propionibacterium freudenreichii TaxID=1744 RepID=D7GIZ1_PROFC|nr:DUF805 domain-containing protein [Propionibacterium freudenreichii]PWM99021.1 MAG: DUF805 domain-containing protein [Propionibacterium sp.]AJQ90223.1 Hypothetical protein RM25_0492 [Propionibacterium freudenreichii subsp. freudenreichii]AWY96314.1 Hypothetical protein CB129slpB_1629 [Propionibacterium freudenreichii]MCQ1998201.1 DUF805 domain-containing protein [Propionibacterium freudenreichii]MCT2979266.1 DUF805 domain-containing protein [Propionibacterium freudenreichii]
MSFGEAVSTCLRKFADPNGRASRAEFWYFYLALLLGNVGAFLLATLVSIVVPPVGGGLFLLILVANVVSLIPLLCVQARRFHDQDLSGALVLLNLFFLVIPLVFMCLEGTRGPNRHGPDPRWGDDAGYGPALYGPGQGGYALPAPDVSYGQPGYGPQPGYGQPDAPGFGQQAYGQGYEQSTWGRADYAQPGYGHQQAAPAWRPDASVPPSPAFGQQGAQPDPDARSYYPDGSRDVPGEPSAAPAGGPDPAPHQSSPFPPASSYPTGGNGYPASPVRPGTQVGPQAQPTQEPAGSRDAFMPGPQDAEPTLLDTGAHHDARNGAEDDTVRLENPAASEQTVVLGDTAASESTVVLGDTTPVPTTDPDQFWASPGADSATRPPKNATPPPSGDDSQEPPAVTGR